MNEDDDEGIKVGGGRDESSGWRWLGDKNSQAWWTRLVCVGILFGSCLVSLVVCPHSKVEESFNLQATHDLYYHGLFPARSDQDASLPFDHLQYPGVVPRTFTGPFLLANGARLVSWIVYPLDLYRSPLRIQFLSRFLLLIWNVYGFFRVSRAVDIKFTSSTSGNYFLLLTACQFHLPFYASRMLPNVFALAGVLHAHAHWLHGDAVTASLWLVATTAIFRCDVLILLFTMGLTMLLRREMTIPQALRVGVTTGLASLALTVPMDSYLWQRPVWPEGQVLFYNTVENKSSEWGTSPWYWYFASALPKTLLATALLIPLAMVRLPERMLFISPNRQGQQGDSPIQLLDRTAIPYLFAVLSFVGLYSILPHKEVRFLFPAIPIFNVVAAVGMTRLHTTAMAVLRGSWQKQKKGMRRKVLVALLLLGGGWSCLLLTAGLSALFVAVSSENYPGGQALLDLQRHLVSSIPSYAPPKPLQAKVYVDVASAMSGVSLFGQRGLIEACSFASGDGTLQVSFVKAGYEEENTLAARDESRNDEDEDEDENGNPTSWLLREGFTHLLTEDPHQYGFDTIRIVSGHPSLDVRRFRIVKQNAIYVMEKFRWLPDQLGISD